LARWVFDIHNSVNERLGKRVLTYAEAEQTFRDMKNGVSDSFSVKKTHAYVGVGLLLGVFAYYKIRSGMSKKRK
jgi:hypothetical protein